MLRQDLGDDEKVFALNAAGRDGLGHRLSDDILGCAIAVHLSRVDQAIA